MQIRALREDELDDWFSFLTRAFRNKENPPTKSYFERHYFSDPWRDCHGIFVAIDDGEIVGSVRNFSRKIYCCSRETKTCGIGEVATHENFRKRGIATSLLERSISYMLENHFPLSMLHTGTASKLYEGLGWTSMTREFLTRSIPFDLYSTRSSAVNLEVCPCNSDIFEKDALDKLMTVYSKTSNKYNGPVVRDNEEYWKGWIDNETGKTPWRDWHRTPRKFVVRLGGTLVGFVVLQFGSEAIRIREWSFFSEQLSDGFDSVDFVLSQVCKFYGERELTFTFPAPISVIKQNDILSYDYTTMYKVVNADLLSRNNPMMVEFHSRASLRNQSDNVNVFWDTDRF